MEVNPTNNLHMDLFPTPSPFPPKATDALKLNHMNAKGSLNSQEKITFRRQYTHVCMKYKTIQSTSYHNSTSLILKHYWLFDHGLITVTTITTTIMRRINIAMHIHLREFFCSFFALCRALAPDWTWSTAPETCGKEKKNMLQWQNI